LFAGTGQYPIERRSWCAASCRTAVTSRRSRVVSKPLEYHGALVTTAARCGTAADAHVMPNVVVIEVPAADDRAYALVRQIRAATAESRRCRARDRAHTAGSSVNRADRFPGGFRASLPQAVPRPGALRDDPQRDELPLTSVAARDIQEPWTRSSAMRCRDRERPSRIPTSGARRGRLSERRGLP